MLAAACWDAIVRLGYGPNSWRRRAISVLTGSCSPPSSRLPEAMDPLVVLAAIAVVFLAVIVPAAVFWHGRMSPRARMRHRVEALGQMVAARAPGQENASERR